MGKKIPDWIVLDFTTGNMRCEHCGKIEKVPLPMPISSFVKWSEYFGDKHKFCKAKLEVTFWHERSE